MSRKRGLVVSFVRLTQLCIGAIGGGINLGLIFHHSTISMSRMKTLILQFFYRIEFASTLNVLVSSYFPDSWHELIGICAYREDVERILCRACNFVNVGPFNNS